MRYRINLEIGNIMRPAYIYFAVPRIKHYYIDHVLKRVCRDNTGLVMCILLKMLWNAMRQYSINNVAVIKEKNESKCRKSDIYHNVNRCDIKRI